ncbi:hypothetical protein SLEP1_g15853 [Rubroshorea leprosula]|uniref:Uncharacterized protein n=1 Tax=Rubroshorea leprosula TaxID=152421 RepID=A0AAV5IZJ3_9ROSI|nr:hypothetical protein SLEP1_g15853 [Rubroshorea leprosula]
MILEVESKSPELKFAGGIVSKLDLLLSEADDESEFSDGFLIEEEKVEEIMRELYKEITSCPCASPTPAANLPSSTSSVSSTSSLIPFSSQPFFAVCDVTDVKSDSCGPSLSDSASTVMAGVEFVGPTFKNVALPEIRSGSPVENEMWMEGGGIDDGVGGVGMDGRDGEVVDDQWLARVLGWDPLEID